MVKYRPPYTNKSGVTLAGIAATIFVVTVLVSSYRTWRFRAYIVLLLLIGMYLEAAGFIVLGYSNANRNNDTAYIIALLGPAVAPSFLAVGCFAVFARVVRLMTPEYCLNAKTLWISRHWFSSIFVSTALAICAVRIAGVAVIGSALAASTPEVEKSRLLPGLTTLRAAHVLHVMSISIFFSLQARFSAKSKPWFQARSLQAPEEVRGVSRLLIMLAVALLLLMAQGIYRLVESTQLLRQYPKVDVQKLDLVTNQWPFWVFDALPMAGVCLGFCFIEPGAILPRAYTGFRVDKKLADQPAMESTQCLVLEEAD